MPCYHPLKGFVIGRTENGKRQYMVTSQQVHHLERKRNGVWQKCYDEFISPSADFLKEFDYLPCGQCIDCRLRYARQWADRCMLELGYHQESWFVTLTYNDEHIPHDTVGCDPESGEIVSKGMLSLRKRDLQLFMKRLRYFYGQEYGENHQLRFFACGEYGGKTFRPHYHLILFGLHLPEHDLTPVSNVNSKYPIFSSEFIKKAWPYGFNSVGAVTWDTCCYTARYILKKQKGLDSDIYPMLGIEPEFTLMSRMPGIAYQYYADHKDEIYKYDTIWMKLETKGYKTKPPHVFDRYYDIDNPDHMEQIKERRSKLAEDKVRTVIAETKMSYEQYLLDCERDHTSRIKGLQRRLFNA